MSGWIKFDKDMLDDPRLIKMVEKLSSTYEIGVTTWDSQFASGGVDLNDNERNALLTATVTGALLRVWCYADTHIRNDDTLPLSESSLDRIAGIPGFCRLMPEEWLRITDAGSIQLPEYTAKNGVEAKRHQAEKNRERQARYRARNFKKSNGVSDDVSNALVTTLDRDLDRDLDPTLRSSSSQSLTLSQSEGVVRGNRTVKNRRIRKEAVASLAAADADRRRMP